MKCPKCGFNSFEFLDSCKKCGTSLASFKRSLGVNPIVYAPGRLQAETQQTLQADVPHEEASLLVAPAVPSDNDTEETFTWDIPALSETARETDTAFSGFDLDFIKDTEKPDAPETGLSSDEEPVAGSPDVSRTETGDAFGDFSFYENTLEPQAEPLITGNDQGEPGSDPFGESGVIGEILPEQLQAADRELELAGFIDDSSLEPESFENEFALEDLSGEVGNSEIKGKETKKDPLDISDFEKEFESIFQTDETSDTGKTGN